MNRWESVSANWEAKITGRGEVLVREAGQKDEYPHATLKYDSHGNLTDYHWSDSRSKHYGLNEDVQIALAHLRQSGML